MISTIILFAACDLLDLLIGNCDSKMKDIREQHGDPETENRVDIEDYHRVEWCYYSQGICYEFTWNDSATGCHVNKYKWKPGIGRQDKEAVLEDYKHYQ